MPHRPAIRTAALAATLAAALCGCELADEPPQAATRPKSAATRSAIVRYERTIHAMGIAPNLIVYAPDPDVAERWLDRGEEAVHQVDRLMSTYKPRSEVSRLNRTDAGVWQPVSAELAYVLKLSRYLSTQSRGRFDITVRPLIELWKQAGRTGRLPTDLEIRAAKTRVGWQAVELDELLLRVRFTRAGMSVDLGAVAKGFAVDRAVRAMQTAGATAGLVEAGGDLYAFGLKPGREKWQVGIRNPRAPAAAPPTAAEPALLNTLVVHDRAVVTSGHYERLSVIAGKRYSHILDPVTGRPVDQQIASVTVVAPTCALADGLATAVAVMGPTDGLKLIEGLENTEALVYLDDGPGSPLRPLRTPGLAPLED